MKTENEEWTPPEIERFDQVEGEDFITNRKTKIRYSQEEFDALERSSPGKMFLIGVWFTLYFPRPPLEGTDDEMKAYISKYLPSREEDVDLSPKKFIDLLNTNGFVTDDSGRAYTEHDVKELDDDPDVFLTIKTH